MNLGLRFLLGAASMLSTHGDLALDICTPLVFSLLL